MTIARPIRAVFEHVVDGARNASWRGPDLTVTLLSGDGGVGSVWQQQVRGFGGRPVEVEYRVTALEPPRRFAYELTAGPARGEAEYLLDARSAELTTVSLRVRMRPRGLFASWTGVVPRQVSSELDSLDRLRNFLEGGGVVAS